ncbi:alpha/beta hydrolase [Methylomarinum vadi]|uniref:alpha/beta hydrolase n=1 Tax=Methylomarinum vadi TaxID=438855 RepID=UPI000A748F3F|nr:alpha/beta hydrolase [Methylomarinum vadi]
MTTFLLLYLLLLLAVFLLQRKLLYFPSTFSQRQQEAQLTELSLKPWPSANQLHGLTSKTPPPNPQGTVLVFHGNAGSAVHRTYFIDALHNLGYRIIVAEYPGYGTRQGPPTESALIRDGIVAAKLAVREFGEPLFLCGESLGSGVAAGIVASQEVPVKGLLFITPFDSMANVAQHHYWYFLARWLLLDSYDNISRLIDYRGPVAMVLADKDEIIPARNSLALFDSLAGPKKLWRFAGASHNTLPLQPWWREAMKFIDD